MPAPTVPLNLDETHTHDTIDFTWDHPSSGTPDTYMIRIDGGSIMDEGPLPSYSLTGLSPGQEVLFEIYAHIYGGSGGSSAVVSMTVTTTGPPNPPTDLDETHTHDTITFTWDAPATGTVPDTYAIRIDGGSWMDEGPSLSYELTGVSPETAVLFEIYALHYLGSLASSTVSLTATTDPTPIPPAPITWGDPDERYYHTGCDRGVLYPAGDSPLAWNGVTGVTESGGGSQTVLYRDGVIYYADTEASDFTGSVNAFFWPDRFSKCLGIPEIAPGLHVDNQRPTPFGLSYRSLVGSGTMGDMFGYQIHLVYNAVASIGSRSRKTLSETPNIMEFSFDLVCKPVKVPGYRPSAHYVVDTRNLPDGALEALELILYGDGVAEARLPDPAELYDLLNFGSSIIFTDHGDGTWHATGSSTNLVNHADGTWDIHNVNGTDLGGGTYELEDTP